MRSDGRSEATGVGVRFAAAVGVGDDVGVVVGTDVAVAVGEATGEGDDGALADGRQPLKTSATRSANRAFIEPFNRSSLGSRLA
jgi:hypothetical protein